LLWFDMKEYGMTHKELTDFFINDVGIAINQGRIFGSGGDGYIRMNAATSKAVVENAMLKLEVAISNLR